MQMLVTHIGWLEHLEDLPVHGLYQSEELGLFGVYLEPDLCK